MLIKPKVGSAVGANRESRTRRLPIFGGMSKTILPKKEFQGLTFNFHQQKNSREGLEMIENNIDQINRCRFEG